MIYFKYFFYLLKHKYLVCKFGRKLGVSWWQIVIHDIDRFLPDRFFIFAQRYDGNFNQLDYLRALQLHFNCSPHHLEYFAFNCFTEPDSVVLLPIPDKYLKEAVADWTAAGLARYNNTAIEFYEKFKDNMLLHEDSRKDLEEILYGK